MWSSDDTANGECDVISTTDMQAIIRAKLLYHEDLLSRILNDKQHSTVALEQMARIIAEAIQEQNKPLTPRVREYMDTHFPSERRASMLKNAGA